MSVTVEQLASEWTLGAWSIGQSSAQSRRWSASVHGYGTCALGNGNTAREAFDAAVRRFRDSYPDKETATAKRKEELRRELAELENAA